MSYYNVYNQYKDFDFESFFNGVRDEDILRIIDKHKLEPLDFLSLLSPVAEKYLEEIAQKAHQLTLNNFGKAIILFTPMYLANYCANKCAYCGFNCSNNIDRRKLTLEEIEQEAIKISETGLKHILILTGSSRKHTPVEYIGQAVEILKKYFDSISIEVYPLEEAEYKYLVEKGVDGLSIYQEVYNQEIYDKVHLAGPKKKYRFRLDAPERACKARIRNVCLGPLLGLDDWKKEFFFGALHAKYLQDKYFDIDISMALPRIREHAGFFDDVKPVNDKSMVQMMIACRLFMPRLGITLTTRETKEFKNNVIPMGVTKISAGVSTEVGGHISQENSSTPQFDIIDPRSVDEVIQDTVKLGYQPVLKDWVMLAEN